MRAWVGLFISGAAFGCSSGLVEDVDRDPFAEELAAEAASTCATFGCNGFADWSWRAPVPRGSGGARTCGRGHPTLLTAAYGTVVPNMRAGVGKALGDWLTQPRAVSARQAREEALWTALDEFVEYVSSTPMAVGAPKTVGAFTLEVDRPGGHYRRLRSTDMQGVQVVGDQDTNVALLRYTVSFGSFTAATTPFAIVVERAQTSPDTRIGDSFRTPGRVFFTFNAKNYVLVPPALKPYGLEPRGNACVAAPATKCPTITEQTAFASATNVAPIRAMPVWVPPQSNFRVHWQLTFANLAPLQHPTALALRMHSGAKGNESPPNGTPIDGLVHGKYVPGTLESPPGQDEKGGYFWVIAPWDPAISSPDDPGQFAVATRIDVADVEACGRPSACHGATTPGCAQVMLPGQKDFCTVIEETAEVFCPMSGTSQLHDQCCAENPGGARCRYDQRYGGQPLPGACKATAAIIDKEITRTAGLSSGFFTLPALTPGAGLDLRPKGSPLWWQSFTVNEWAYRNTTGPATGLHRRALGSWNATPLDVRPSNGTRSAPDGVVFKTRSFQVPHRWCSNLVLKDEASDEFMCGPPKHCLQTGTCPQPGGGSGGGPGGAQWPTKPSTCGRPLIGDLVCTWNHVTEGPQERVFCGITNWSQYAGYAANCMWWNHLCDDTRDATRNSCIISPTGSDAIGLWVDRPNTKLLDFGCHLEWRKSCDGKRTAQQ
jgi:hypothetical protein